MAFVNVNRGGDFDGAKAVIDGYRKLAREEYGHELQIWGHCYAVQGETEQDAKDYFDEYVHQKGDWEAAANLIETMGLNAPRPPRHVEGDEDAFYRRMGRLSADRQR